MTRSLFLVRIPGFVIPLAYLFSAPFLLLFNSINQTEDIVRASREKYFQYDQLPEVFDFIVIGGGSSGSVLANRLSVHHTVLLLEAGGDPNPLSTIPVSSPILLGQPGIDWGHKTVPQLNAGQGLKDHVGLFPRGRGLGGTSIINSMIYQRGNPLDYDNWAEITGDSSWKYESLLPFFKKIENYNGHWPNETTHGKGGPLHVEKLRFAPGAKYWLEGAKEMGYEIRDLSGHQTSSFAPMDVTMKRGTRFDSHRAYIKPIIDRKNLKIYRYSTAIKIHLDRRKHAYGVTYRRHGMTKFVRSRREIILSGGSINSPHLLMISGIGPRDHLKSLNITCRLNLPVGQNLQDHVFTTVGPIILKRKASIIADRDVTIGSLREFIENGTGPLVSITGISGAGGIASNFSTNPNWPDIFYHFIGGGVHGSLGSDQEKSFGFQTGFLRRFYSPWIGRDAFFVVVTVARPQSQGRILLKSNKPDHKPIIDPRFLDHPQDINVMYQGISWVLDLIRTKTMRNIGAAIAPNPLQPCAKYNFLSERYWYCYIKYYSITLHHQCCTAPMGKSDSVNSVVDSNFRVQRSNSLRVVDASIFPVITNANPNIPCIMVAEKASFTIREYWAQQYEVCTNWQWINYLDANTCCYSQLS